MQGPKTEIRAEDVLPRLHISSELLGEIFTTLTSSGSGGDNSNFLLARLSLDETAS